MKLSGGQRKIHSYECIYEEINKYNNEKMFLRQEIEKEQQHNH